VAQLGVFGYCSYDEVLMSIKVRPVVPSRLVGRGGHESSRAPSSVVGAYVALTKPRIIELLLITTVPTMVLAEGGWPSWGLVLVTLFGGTLAAGGANAINMYIDRDIDALMERTKMRPLVTGVIAPRNALIFAISLEFIAFGVLWAGANLLSGILAICATLFYVFVYSLWLKRTSKQNIVIGGAAGAVPVLVGWAAVTNSVSWSAVLLFAVIFFWTPPHFWALAIRHNDDYKAAGVPMLPAVVSLRQTTAAMVRYCIAVVVVSLALIPVADLGWVYGVVAGIVGALFLGGTIALGRRPTEAGAMRLFSFSITYISLLFLALTVDVLVR
jgi:protoheme IX farnesyltransferase